MDHSQQLIVSLQEMTDLQALSLKLKQTFDAMIQHSRDVSSRLLLEGARSQPAEIRLQGGNLCIGGTNIPLESRPLTLKLVEVFFRREDLKATREKIMQGVYGLSPEASERMVYSHDCNLNKLLSRTRRHIENAVHTTQWGRGVDWLVFDHQQKLWNFMMPKRQPDPGAIRLALNVEPILSQFARETKLPAWGEGS